MQRTLFFIPHEIAGIPVLGFGWLLMFIVAALLIRAWLARRNRQSVIEVLSGEGLIWLVAAIVVVFVLPKIELTNLDGEPVGMAIRGYGVMLLAGVGTAVGLAAYRAKRRGIDPEIIYSMAPWAFFGGILGARLFFVVQYRDRFITDSLQQTIGNMLDFTGGGLVVYGSFIGGFIAVSYYIIRHKLPLLTFGDVIVPCMFIGVFFGRVGCLMNGCCYGGQCEQNWAAIEFPPNSPVYTDQLRSGDLLGFTYDAATGRIDSVREGSLAAQAEFQVGDRLDDFTDDLTPLENASRDIPQEDARTGVIVTVEGQRHRWGPSELPDRARPVYAAQLLSSVCSLVLCLLLCGLSWFNFREGTVMMLGFASYAVLRFVLELVRVDEAGQFGTNLSISQWVSVFVFFASMAGLWWIHRSPRPPQLQTQVSSGT
ncbi:MAG: prolipoprotein diacylglyceryl transferase [Rubripirellula sp.]